MRLDEIYRLVPHLTLFDFFFLRYHFLSIFIEKGQFNYPDYALP
jgi:hypothetical protein